MILCNAWLESRGTCQAQLWWMLRAVKETHSEPGAFPRAGFSRWQESRLAAALRQSDGTVVQPHPRREERVCKNSRSQVRGSASTNRHTLPLAFIVWCAPVPHIRPQSPVSRANCHPELPNAEQTNVKAFVNFRCTCFDRATGFH